MISPSDKVLKLFCSISADGKLSSGRISDGFMFISRSMMTSFPNAYFRLFAAASARLHWVSLSIRPGSSPSFKKSSVFTAVWFFYTFPSHSFLKYSLSLSNLVSLSWTRNFSLLIKSRISLSSALHQWFGTLCWGWEGFLWFSGFWLSSFRTAHYLQLS